MSISWWFNMVCYHNSTWFSMINADSTWFNIVKLVYNSNNYGLYNYSIHGVNLNQLTSLGGGTLLKHDQTILARVLFRGLAGAGDCYSQARLHWCYRRGTRPALSCNGNVVGISLGMVGKSLGKILGRNWWNMILSYFPTNLMRFMGLISWDSGFK